MPIAPRKPCAGPGCGQLVPSGTRHCPSCKTNRGRAQNAHPHRKEDQRFYHSKAWLAAREEVLQRDSVCKRCDIAPSTEVHHKEERTKRPDLELDLDNLEGLCKPCHSRETATGSAGFKSRVPVASPARQDAVSRGVPSKWRLG
jgi:5-methylcytosine-specific restriction enzyme A